MREAATRAQADDLHRARSPTGYDTVIGERGSRSRGGQRQRIAIARALVMDPRILILDDATSSVDAADRRYRIRAALAEVMRGRTTFIIAHRPSTIALAEEVVVLDHGRIVERGSHAELLAAGGHYARMFGARRGHRLHARRGRRMSTPTVRIDAAAATCAGGRRSGSLDPAGGPDGLRRGRRSGPHGSGAELEEFSGWRAFLHLARELQLARLAALRDALPASGHPACVTAMIVFTMTNLSIPYLVKVAIDSGIRRHDLHVVTLVIVVFLGVNVANVLAGYLQTYFVSWVGERMLLDLRRTLFAHIQKLSLDFFSRQKTGWIVSRLTNDIDAIDQLVTDGVTSLVTNLLTLIGAAIFLLVLDWRLALATLAIMPVLLAATLVFRTHSARSYAKVRDRIANVSAHLQESISGIRVIKAFRREEADYAVARARERRRIATPTWRRWCRAASTSPSSSSSRRRPSSWCSGTVARW